MVLPVENLAFDWGDGIKFAASSALLLPLLFSYLFTYGVGAGLSSGVGFILGDFSGP